MHVTDADIKWRIRRMDTAPAPNASALVIVAQDLGIFTWDVIGDRLRGDSEIAGFFGLRKATSRTDWGSAIT
jgi:hypothetical protein